MDPTLPQVPAEQPWFQPVAAALQPLLAPVEAQHQCDIDLNFQANHPWLVLENWPLPSHASLHQTPVVLAWEDTEAALYLPQQHLDSLAATAMMPAPALVPVRSEQGREVAGLLRAQGWSPWARVPVPEQGGIASAMAQLLTHWVSGLQAPKHPPKSGGPATDLARVRAGLSERPSHHADPKPVSAQALTEELEKTVRGQTQAITQVAQQIAAHLAKVQRQRPEVVFACGTTGVGKTLTALTMAPTLNALEGLEEHDPRRWRTVRLDMNEYQESHRVAQIFGAPPGYAGYGEDSALVAALRHGPRVVIIFDEIEKAHPDIWVALMNLMESGRVGVPHGGAEAARKPGDTHSHELDCTDAIVVFTSNLDAAGMVSEYHPDRQVEDLDMALRNRLKRSGIRPELVNRIGTCVVYLPISDEARVDIVLAEVTAAGREFGLEVRHVCPDLLLQILRQPAHGDYGARSDRRATARVLGQALLQARHAGWQAVRLLSHPTRAEPCA